MKLRTKIAAMLIGLFSIGLTVNTADAQVRVTIGHRYHRPVHRHTVVRTYYGYGHGHRYDRYHHTYIHHYDHRYHNNGLHRGYDHRH
jgi:hypothetical protein